MFLAAADLPKAQKIVAQCEQIFLGEYRTADGKQSIWYDDAEIEDMMEAELRRASLMPTVEAPAVDIESFIDSHLRTPLDQYADLPSDVLGLTDFRPGQRPSIRINKSLTGAMDDDGFPGVTGRWRATLAHEAGHVLLHRILYEFDSNQPRLFPDDIHPDSGQTLHRCLKRDVAYRPNASGPLEVQANKAMAALLMPRSVFTRVAKGTGVRTADPTQVDAITRNLAQRFEVSRQATIIRLKTLGFIEDTGATSLFARPN